MENLHIAEFYHDRSIFVTGGTGFMGKVLVEKLLRSCPGIRRIYLLMRPKRGRALPERLAEMINSLLFDILRKERPTDLHKIVPIHGDITDRELGISKSDQNILKQEVSIVFHSAATVKFDEPLKKAVNINMLGTRRLVELCHRMDQLQAVIHVSTAYCNCDKKEVQEMVYPPPFNPQRIIECVEWMNDDLIETVTPKLIGNRPNTYTFTKAMAEHMLMTEGGSLPVAIVRPSIVVSSIAEPVPGWIDNWNGATGLTAAVGKGILRSMRGNPNATTDIIPVDIVINLMIVAAWQIAHNKRDRTNGCIQQPRVYHCVTGMQHPLSWGRFADRIVKQWRVQPQPNAIWYPDFNIRSSWLIHLFYFYILQRFYAYIIDAVFLLTGKPPTMKKINRKLETATNTVEYFTSNGWIFHDDNVKELSRSISQRDQTEFPFDVSRIDWDSFLEIFIRGIRTYMFKEEDCALPNAKKHMQRLNWLIWLSKAAILIIMWQIFL